MMIKGLQASVWVAALSLLAACGPEEASEPAAQAVNVETITAAAAAGYTASSSYTGRIEAREDSQLGFEIGGLLESVAVDEGSEVTRGDALAVLDTARLRAQRAEAEAALSQVRAQLDLAGATFARTEEAFAYKGVSQQQLDETRQQVEALEASEGVALARLERIEVDIAKATLRAPFNGVVILRTADPGAVMAAGTPLLAVQSTDAHEARIGVSASAARGLEPGESHILTIDGAQHEAILKSIVPRRDEASQTIDAIFTLTESSDFIRPGDLARLDSERFVAVPGYWIPVSALIEGPRGLWQVLVAEEYGEDYTLVKHTLEVLHANEQHAYVRGTLQTGDLLVSNGTHRVVAGQIVNVRSQLARSDAPEGGVEQ